MTAMVSVAGDWEMVLVSSESVAGAGVGAKEEEESLSFFDPQAEQRRTSNTKLSTVTIFFMITPRESVKDAQICILCLFLVFSSKPFEKDICLKWRWEKAACAPSRTLYLSIIIS